MCICTYICIYSCLQMCHISVIFLCTYIFSIMLTCTGLICAPMHLHVHWHRSSFFVPITSSTSTCVHNSSHMLHPRIRLCLHAHPCIHICTSNCIHWHATTTITTCSKCLERPQLQLRQGTLLRRTFSEVGCRFVPFSSAGH